MRYLSSKQESRIDLRGFRERLIPRKTLGQAARGARVDKSLLSRVETGKQKISTFCARRLARFYSRVTGRCVTAGEVLDMAELSAARRRAGGEEAQPVRSSGAMEAPDVGERSVAS
jgi:Helix-turn-helix domain